MGFIKKLILKVFVSVFIVENLWVLSVSVLLMLLVIFFFKISFSLFERQIERDADKKMFRPSSD